MAEKVYDLASLDSFNIYAAEANSVTWQGRRALRLVNGLAVIPGLILSDVRIEVDINAPGSAYPGIAFRITDRMNYELGYAQPHTSGLWDALQYDPVFHQSNTWQIYHGSPYQKAVTVPTSEWFHLRADIQGERAAFTVDDQPPLIVNHLAHGPKTGSLGIWTYLPAMFADLLVSASPSLPDNIGNDPVIPDGTVTEWLVEGFGVITCEPNGILNLNRHLPVALGEVHLARQFELPSGGPVEIALGFSDELTLQLDEQVIFEGQQTFANLPEYAARGYVDANQHCVRQILAPGVHTLAACLKVTESFGWGLILSLQGEQIQLLPV